MNKIFTFLIMLLSIHLSAQFYEITYETQVQTHYTTKGLKWFEEWEDDPKDRQELIELNKNPPKEVFEFLYSDHLSKTSYIQKVRNSQNDQTFFITKTPIGIFGTTNDYANNEFSYNMDVYGKNYLVKGDLIELEIKETGNKKEILNLPVIEATAKVNNKDFIIWYTTAIPYHFSPDIYYTKKGFILEMHYKKSDDESEIINSWIATNKKEIKKSSKINLSTKGTLINSNQVDAIWDEANNKRNEMFNNDGIDKK